MMISFSASFYCVFLLATHLWAVSPLSMHRHQTNREEIHQRSHQKNRPKTHQRSYQKIHQNSHLMEQLLIEMEALVLLVVEELERFLLLLAFYLAAAAFFFSCAAAAAATASALQLRLLQPFLHLLMPWIFHLFVILAIRAVQHGPALMPY